MNLLIENQDVDVPIEHDIRAQAIQCMRDHTQDHVYAIGQIKPYFATIDLEKQYESAASFVKQPTSNFYNIVNYEASAQEQSNLSFRPFLYLAQQANWVFTINNVDTYELRPRTVTQLNSLINASMSSDTDVILIGLIDKQNMFSSGGLSSLPTVMIEHVINSADIDKQKSNSMSLGALECLKPNIGLSSLERASNYLVTHFGQINTNQAQAQIMDNVCAVHFQEVSETDHRSIVEIILSSSEDTRFACNIDVTDAYPFISSQLAPFAKSS